MPYKNFSRNELSNILSPHTQVIEQKVGQGCLLFSGRGGRLLGLYPKADGLNTLWVNAQLEQVLQQDEWLVGGERLWVAPEQNFYYQQPEQFSGVHIPESIDPGQYNYRDELCFTSRLTLHNFAQRQDYANSTLTRRFSPIEDPYQSGLAYAGVAIHDQIAVPILDANFCAWSIAQVYVADAEQVGTALFPVEDHARLLHYFDEIPHHQADIQSSYARFRLDGQAIYKLGIRPEDIVWNNPIKVVYIAPYGDGLDEWFCVIKRSHDVPRNQTECLDTARNTSETEKAAVQAYNHGQEEGQDRVVYPFGEIELQFRSAINQAGLSVSEARHELLAYSGSYEEISAWVQGLLGENLAPLKLY